MNGLLSQYHGIELIGSSALVDRGPDEIVDRTMRERFFTLPFRPFKKTKAIPTFVPSNKYYVIGKSRIVAHPAKIKLIVEALKENESE